MRFVLIDRLLELEPGTRAVASKRIAEDEDYFADHFPGRPIVPGVLLIESMAQTGGWLIAASHRFDRRAVLGMVKNARFRSWVGPGDELRIESEIVSLHDERARTRAKIEVGGQLRASAELYYVLWRADEDASDQDEAKNTEWMRRVWREIGGAELVDAGEGP